VPCRVGSGVGIRAGDRSGAQPSGYRQGDGYHGVGGNTFGLMAPIATSYIIALTGSFDRAFVVAGLLPLAGAAATFLMTRRPIEAHPRR
jgi:hypothetical protein